MQISFEERKIHFKVVFCGPAGSGKTTNLVRLRDQLADLVLNTRALLGDREDPPPLFDFVPLSLGEVAGYTVLFNFYSMPSQLLGDGCRLLILDRADGVVFVADSQAHRLDANVESWRQMHTLLFSDGITPPGYPLVLQYNKRDCPDALSLGTIERELDVDSVPIQAAIARDGQGVTETARLICRQVIGQFRL